MQQKSGSKTRVSAGKVLGLVQNTVVMICDDPLVALWKDQRSEFILILTVENVRVSPVSDNSDLFPFFEAEKGKVVTFFLTSKSLEPSCKTA